MRFRRFLVATVLAGCTAAPAAAGIFANYSAARNNRFTTGTTNNPTFLLAGYDISGVAIDSTFSARGTALITPEHVIGAWHFLPSTISFLGTDGVQREFGVAQWTRLTTNGQISDVAIGRLSTEVMPSDNISPLPIAIGPDAQFIGHELYAFAQNNQAGRNVIDTIVTVATSAPPNDNPTVTTAYDFDSYQNGGTGGVGDDEIGLAGGDSGHATLILSDGQLALLGANFAIDGTPSQTTLYSSYSSLVRDYLGQIQTIALADGQTISTLTIPEPSGTLAAVGAAAMLLVRRSRRLLA